LSGEICATENLFKTLLKCRDWPDGWGVDIWLLIESAMRDNQITEVYLGTKVHTSRQEYLVDVIRLSKMAEQVSLTTFKEAIKYKRIGNLKEVHL
jgi:glucosyl-3-phosphoglycerate synthase